MPKIMHPILPILSMLGYRAIIFGSLEIKAAFFPSSHTSAGVV